MIINKEFLREHAEHRKELRDELQRYELTYGISYFGNSPSNIDGMPHGHSISNTTMDSVIRSCDAENNIHKLKSLIDEEVCWIEKILGKVKKADQKNIIRLKYYNCMEWEDIADQIYGDIKGYYNELDKYKRKCMRIHGRALDSISRVQKEGEIDAGICDQ